MKYRVLVLTHQDIEVPDSVDGFSDKEIVVWRTEYDVLTALAHLGHEGLLIGGADGMAAIRQALLDWKPHIVFNLLEEFRGRGIYVPYLLGYCELMGQPFTGCNPAGLLLTDNKALTKKILRYHRIPVPAFLLVARGRRVRRPQRLGFPLIVKSNTAHGSVGIAQASVVNSEEELVDRVAFVHESLQTDAIVEQYIEGREIYVALIGNRRLTTFPIRELGLESMPEGTHRIATQKVKWDLDYRDKHRIKCRIAERLPDGLADRVFSLCKRVYRILNINGYARMDLRLTDAGRVYVLEPNPNPDLALDDDFAEAAEAGGMPYDRLIQRIINLGLKFHVRSAP